MQVVQLPGNFPGKMKVNAWICKVHIMPASRELEDDDVRQLLVESESSYNDFVAFLNIGRAWHDLTCLLCAFCPWWAPGMCTRILLLC